MAKNKIYVVVRGIKPGVYDSWHGEDGAEVQVRGFPGALFKGFENTTDARAWLKRCNYDLPETRDTRKGKKTDRRAEKGKGNDS